MIFKPRPEFREIARRLQEAPALKWRLFHINLDRVGFYYEETCEKSKCAAECLPVIEPWKSVLADCGIFLDWLIVVYGYHAEGKSREWLQIVLYHELRHIGIDGRRVEHSVEEFDDILQHCGLMWAAGREPLPDICRLKLEIE